MYIVLLILIWLPLVTPNKVLFYVVSLLLYIVHSMCRISQPNSHNLPWQPTHSLTIEMQALLHACTNLMLVSAHHIILSQSITLPIFGTSSSSYQPAKALQITD